LKAKQSISGELEINDKTALKRNTREFDENESKTKHKWGIADKRQKSHKSGTSPKGKILKIKDRKVAKL